MRVFSVSDREAFEDMVISLEMCTESTEMLFRKESVLASDPGALMIPEIGGNWFDHHSAEDVANDAKKNPENWA